MNSDNQVPEEHRLLFDKLCHLCSRAERSPMYILNKCRQSRVEESAARLLLNLLCEKDFVDEFRYARAFLNDKASLQKWGPEKIRAGLRAQGVSSAAINDAFENFDFDVFRQNLRQIFSNFSLNFKPGTAEYAKVVRKLQLKGYHYNDIKKLFDR
jgi:regulatory protein